MMLRDSMIHRYQVVLVEVVITEVVLLLPASALRSQPSLGVSHPKVNTAWHLRSDEFRLAWATQVRGLPTLPQYKCQVSFSQLAFEKIPQRSSLPFPRHLEAS